MRMYRSLNSPFHAFLITATGAGLLFLTGCGSDSAPTSSPVAATTQAPSGATALTIQDPWVKTAEKDMTATFGTLKNTGTAPITIVSAKTSASSRTELHEVVEGAGAMTMRPKKGGFTIPAGQKLELKPGGLHIMIMDLAKPIASGDEVTVRLTLADGTTKDFSALAKATTAGEEKYESGKGMEMSAATPSATS
jgi:periplasmic copper chaperone A